jgi:signal transduction histidine kinase
MDPVPSERLCGFFKRIKTVGLFERIFSWQRVLSQENDAFAEYQRLQIHKQEMEQKLAVLVVKSQDLTQELEYQKERVSRFQQQLSLAMGAYKKANKMAHALFGIHRHDVSRQMTLLMSYVKVSEMHVTNPVSLAEFIKKELKILDTINHQFDFALNYMSMGWGPIWQNLNEGIRKAAELSRYVINTRGITVVIDCPDLEVYADPILWTVFSELIENALHYGGDGTTRIRISAKETNGRLALVCEHDGAGFSDEDRQHLFEMGYGEHSGLFRFRDMLNITGITIHETGSHGKGARFEMVVPEGAYRFTARSESVAKIAGEHGQLAGPGAVMDPVLSDNLRVFFERIKNSRLFERIFSWQKVLSQAYDAIAEFQQLQAHIKEKEQELARLIQNNRDLTLGIEYRKEQIEHLQKILSSEELHTQSLKEKICTLIRNGEITPEGIEAMKKARLNLQNRSSLEELRTRSLNQKITELERERRSLETAQADSHAEIQWLKGGMAAIMKTNEDLQLRIHEWEDMTGELPASDTKNLEYMHNIENQKEISRLQGELSRTKESCMHVSRKVTLDCAIKRHDISNHLAVIRGLLALSKEYAGDADRITEFISREEKIVDTIEHVFNCSWQNLNFIIRTAIATTHIQGKIVVAECPDLEVFDHSTLSRTFYDLIRYAHRYGGDKLTQIRIFSQKTENGLVIVCEDDGVGINDEDRKHLFEQGFRDYKGLTLFHVRENLGMNGITIQETGSYGKGARFEMIVPKGAFRSTERNDIVI